MRDGLPAEVAVDASGWDVRARLTDRAPYARMLLAAARALLEAQSFERAARKFATHVALEPVAKYAKQIVGQDLRRLRRAWIDDVARERADPPQRSLRGRHVLRDAAPRPDAEQRAKRHHREGEPIAVHVMRT